MADGSGAPTTLKLRIGSLVEAQPFPYTYEEQFIIRFPPSVAAELREELRELSQPEDLSVTFTDPRRATVMFHGRKYVGVLVDLPTIIEAQRTFDRSQYYKIADICQMLLVLPDNAESQAKIKEYETNGWQHPDGLTPPLKNVRVRRFSRTASYGKQKDVEAIEKRVQALLDRDSAVTTSTFTVYDGNGRAILTGGKMDGKFQRPAPGEADEMESMVAESEDEELAAELEEAMMAEDATEVIESSTQTVESLPPTEVSDKATPMTTPQASSAILELQAKINERKAQLASVTNPLIRARLEDVIRQLEEDLKSRRPGENFESR